jgi:hypothetical protein
MRTDQKIEALGSCNRLWKLGKGDIYGWWAHNATSFVPVTIAKLTREL